MFRLFLVMIPLMIFVGCTQKAEEIKPKDNVAVTLPQKQFSWPEERKNFWISLYFSKMSWQPDVRQRMLPETLFEVCTCIVETFERRYELEHFEKVLNSNTPTEAAQQEIWKVSYNCSVQGIINQNQRLQKQKMENPDIKEML